MDAAVLMKKKKSARHGRKRKKNVQKCTHEHLSRDSECVPLDLATMGREATEAVLKTVGREALLKTVGREATKALLTMMRREAIEALHTTVGDTNDDIKNFKEEERERERERESARELSSSVVLAAELTLVGFIA